MWGDELQAALDYRRKNYRTKSKLTYKKAENIRKKYRTGLYSMRQLAKQYNVVPSSILRIVRGDYYV